MHPTTRLGFIGEVKAITEFLKLDFNIYTPLSDGNDKFDFIAHKDGKLIKVEVKSTSAKDKRYNSGYIVNLKSNRNKKVHYFDSSKSDILAIYVEPIDTACFFKSKDITNKNGISVRNKASGTISMRNHKQHIISNHTDLEKVIKKL